MPLFALGWRFAPAEKGDAALRQRLVADLALRCLLSASAPLYSRLYADGLINGSFECEADYSAGAAMLIVSGESTDPEAVLTAICDEVRSVVQGGLDATLIERVKRSDYGARLRGLGYFGELARKLASGAFTDYCALESLDVMETIGREEVERFIRETMPQEKLAMSVVRPRA